MMTLDARVALLPFDAHFKPDAASDILARIVQNCFGGISEITKLRCSILHVTSDRLLYIQLCAYESKMPIDEANEHYTSDATTSERSRDNGAMVVEQIGVRVLHTVDRMAAGHRRPLRSRAVANSLKSFTKRVILHETQSVEAQMRTEN